MMKLPNILTVWCTITIFLLMWGNIVMVRPEDEAEDHGYQRLTAVDQHFEANAWTNWEPKQDLKPINVITTVLDVETQEKWKFHPVTGERKGEIHTTEDEKSDIDQGIKKMTKINTMKKPRFLCLHGGNSNAAKLKTSINAWPNSVIENMDLVYINAPFRVYKEDDDEHYEWYTVEKINTEYDNFEEGILYIEDRMIELGPFDGVLGFSQGAIVAGALPGMQEHGVCLTKVEKIEHVVIMSGAKFGGEEFPQPKLAESAYASPINIPSLHMFGENDIARTSAPELIDAFVDPLVIYHHGGHEVPTLDEHGLKIMFEFLKRINAIV